MNTSGIQYPEILKKVFEKYYDIELNEYNMNDEIEELISQYYFSEYYYNLKYQYHINVPLSYIYSLEYVYNNLDKINKIIKSFPNEEVFARLDTLSAKPTKPYKNINNILKDMRKSERTKNTLQDINHNMILREWIDLKNYYELRCFIEEKKIKSYFWMRCILSYSFKRNKIYFTKNI